MKSVLVTGASGFIGGNLIQHLLKENVHISTLTRHHSDRPEWPASIKQFFLDLENQSDLSEICQNIDTIFHIAGYAHNFSDSEATAKEKNKKINLEATIALLEAAKKEHVKKFIFISTVAAAGESPQCTDEDFEKAPTSFYGISKRDAEKKVLEYGEMYNSHVCILRPTLVYGAGGKGNLLRMIQAIDKGHFPPLPPIQNRRSMIGIHDLCEAIILSAKKNEANGKTYIVTDGVSYSTSDIYNLILKELYKKPSRWWIPHLVLKAIARVGDSIESHLHLRFPLNSSALHKLTGSNEYSSARIQKELGFQPKETLGQLMPEIISRYQKQEIATSSITLSEQRRI